MLLLENSFPFSVAAAGTLKASNLEVYAVPSSAAFDDGSLTDDEKLPGSLLSNSLVTGAVTLGGTSEVRGDVTTRGTVVTTDSAKILGDTITANEPQTIPDIKATQFDPTGQRFVGKWSPGDGTVDGARIHEGDLTLSEDLKFEDGLLYVKGNITVTGTLKGKGALVATKNITVTGSMNTKADLAALVAGGDISITGQGTTTSSFQGLILAEGSFKAKDTTLVGSALTLDKNGSVQLERVRTVAARDLTKIDLNYAVELKKAIDANFKKFPIGIFYKTQFVELAKENYSTLEGLASQIASDASNGQVLIEISPGKYSPTPPPGSFMDGPLLQGTTYWNAYQTQVKNNAVQYEDVFQLDFNKFLKTKGGFRPLLQRVSSL